MSATGEECQRKAPRGEAAEAAARPGVSPVPSGVNGRRPPVVHAPMRARRVARVRLGARSRVGVSYRHLVRASQWPHLCQAAAQRVGVDGRHPQRHRAERRPAAASSAAVPVCVVRGAWCVVRGAWCVCVCVGVGVGAHGARARLRACLLSCPLGVRSCSSAAPPSRSREAELCMPDRVLAPCRAVPLASVPPASSATARSRPVPPPATASAPPTAVPSSLAASSRETQVSAICSSRETRLEG